MKRTLILFFVLIFFMILYQTVMGKNGLIEGVKLRRELVALDLYINYLMSQNDELAQEIELIKKDIDYRETLAGGMGFFKDDVILYRILKDKEPVFSRIENNLILNEFIEKSIKIKQLDIIKVFVNIFFMVITIVFVLLVAFGVKKIE